MGLFGGMLELGVDPSRYELYLIREAVKKRSFF